MKKYTFLLASLAMASASTMAATTINGAGATFPYPVYADWAKVYNQETGVQLNYQAIGSGGGIKQIEAKTVDFGASDAPLSKEELDKNGLVQFPAVMGSIVPVINIKGIKAGELKLSGEALADIYLGKVKYWDDAEVQSLNSDLTLPHQMVITVHRSDGSGTTYNYTDYLQRASKTWAAQVGMGKEIAWPKAATGLGGKGNAGVANLVKRTPGAIGYVEYAYAEQNSLVYTQMKNKDGNFVKPELASFQAAAANADWKNAPGFKLMLNDQPGAKSWPMTAATFILMHKEQANPETAQEVLKFFKWGYKHGDIATKLGYVPMPANVVDMVETMWSKDIKSTNGKAVYTK
ncbi:phosphate ABC transporter substrate-binding protein PstS [Vibrio sp. S17_S38]|uniref:phosphate ABC transporter substrate-binding protein PstS n=1 Tax=Vibrio sp. S17_S38 TaxID=2720229 RepID=UPI001680BBC1|nr:phosphate ABC transporter substrate-binding protein PstS [Vibrio sp. S17_S38]MBD1573326.1 phosphate ABC transporter substrate-binding protein PstS [Vibrio sp. S17_S38]